MEIRTATQTDLTFVRDLQRRFSNQIGFIPPAATQREIEWGHVFHAALNDDDAGFLLIQPALSGQRTTAAIIQAAVRMDAQRQKIGLTLVEAIARKAHAAGSHILQCCCRADLEANLFWEAAGFVAAATRQGGKSYGEKIILWRKPLIESAIDEALPPEGKPRGPGGKFAKRIDATPLFAVPGRPCLDVEPRTDR